jgi:surfeit locus 1 family protein
MRRLRASHWVFVVLAVALGALFIRLGVWQLERLEQRRASNAAIQAQIDRPVVNLNSDPIPTDGLTYRRIRASGTFDPTQEIVLSNRAYSGQAGVHLVTPLRIEGRDAAVLVDRGWIPASQASPAERTSFAVSGTIEVAGIGRPSQQEPAIALLADPTRGPGSPPLDAWRFLDLSAIQPQVPYTLLPVILEASEPVGGVTPPKLQSEIDLSEGSHLSYAIEWFAFAAIALLGGAAWLVRSARTTRPGEPS